MKTKEKKKCKSEIVFFIDKQQFKTELTEISAGDLLSQYANEDPAETTLVLKKCNDLTKLEDDQIIHLQNGIHFVVFHDGPTPVSFFGPERFVAELADIGYKPELVTGEDGLQYVVLNEYEVPLGRFAGQIIDLGLLATQNFPESVGSSIHVRAIPQLYDKTDTVTNVRNIIDSGIGVEWLYWSKNFNWNQQQHTARRLMSQVAGVFHNA